MEEQRIEEIQQIIKDCIQKEVKVQIRYADQQENKESIIDISKMINMNIEYEE